MWRYHHRGLYYTHLKRYTDRFPRDHIQVLLYEDWRATGIPLLRKVFRFLDVDEHPNLPDKTLRLNTTDIDRFQARALDRFEPSTELETKLAHLYRDEINKLQDLIDTDLSSWLHPRR